MGTKSKFIICNINDWGKFMRLSTILNTQQWLFRGQGNSSWKLKTTHERYINNRKSKFDFRMNNTNGIMRNLEELTNEEIIKPTERKLKQAENYAIEIFQKNAHRLAKYEKKIDILAAMQHYGAPTRLLDVTDSLFVALYFAFELDDCSAKSVWAFRREHLLHGQNELETIKKVRKNYESILKSNPQYAPDVYENGIFDFLENEYQQQIECIELVEQVLAEDSKEFKGIVPVVPRYYNERISAQNGSFLFPMSLLSSFEDNLKQTLKISDKEFNQPKEYSIQDYFDENFDFQSAKLIKFIFDPVQCYSADDIFRCANISAKNLFPDLTGIAKSIRY